jgi:hypothetical protein
VGDHGRLSVQQSVSLFLKSRPLLVFHHLVLIFGYPLLVYDGLRKGMGDFLIGTLFLRELSSPLLSAAKIMRKIKMEGSVLYQVNGAALVLLFFLVRIASTPLTLLLYSSQHHDWSLVRALSAMRPICHLMLSAELTLQLYCSGLGNGQRSGDRIVQHAVPPRALPGPEAGTSSAGLRTARETADRQERPDVLGGRRFAHCRVVSRSLWLSVAYYTDPAVIRIQV